MWRARPVLLQASVNEAACKQLERRLQDITAKLVADRREHADKVRCRRYLGWAVRVV
jgi:hypothetical protein